MKFFIQFLLLTLFLIKELTAGLKNYLRVPFLIKTVYQISHSFGFPEIFYLARVGQFLHGFKEFQVLYEFFFDFGGNQIKLFSRLMGWFFPTVWKVSGNLLGSYYYLTLGLLSWTFFLSPRTWNFFPFFHSLVIFLGGRI